MNVRIASIACFILALVAYAVPRANAQAHVLDYICSGSFKVTNGYNTGPWSCATDSAPVIIRHISIRTNIPTGQHMAVGVGLTPTTIVWCSPSQLVGNNGYEDVATCSTPIYLPVPAN